MPTIHPPNLFEQLGNRESPEVRDALTRTCRVCHAVPGADCTQLTNNYPLQNRIVHLDRTYG